LQAVPRGARVDYIPRAYNARLQRKQGVRCYYWRDSSLLGRVISSSQGPTWTHITYQTSMPSNPGSRLPSERRHASDRSDTVTGQPSHYQQSIPWLQIYINWGVHIRIKICKQLCRTQSTRAVYCKFRNLLRHIFIKIVRYAISHSCFWYSYLSNYQQEFEKLCIRFWRIIFEDCFKL
jgi:hypothetical protein